MLAIFCFFFFWKKSRQKLKIFIILNSCYSIMFDHSIMLFLNVWKLMWDFQKVQFFNFSQNMAKVMLIWMSKEAQKPMSLKKKLLFSVFHLYLTCRTLNKLSRIALVNLLKILEFKILDNAFSTKNSFNENNCFFQNLPFPRFSTVLAKNIYRIKADLLCVTKSKCSNALAATI